MHDALGNALVVEMRDLFAQDEIFEQRRPAQPGFQRVLVVRDRHALVGGQRLPAESTRTRSSGPLLGLSPICGLPSPVLSEALVSVSVLPVAAGSDGSTVWPGSGCARCLAVLARLVRVVRHRGRQGLCCLDLRGQRVHCGVRLGRSERAGPLTVERELDFAEVAPDVRPGGVPRPAAFSVFTGLSDCFCVERVLGVLRVATE